MKTVICTLSGVVASEDEMAHVDDQRGNPPLGWTRITIETTVPNEDYDDMDQVERTLLSLSRQALVASGLTKDDARLLARWQTAAAFSHLRSLNEPTDVITVVVDIAPRERVPAVGDVVDKVLGELGVSLYEDDDDDDDDVVDGGDDVVDDDDGGDGGDGDGSEGAPTE